MPEAQTDENGVDVGEYETDAGGSVFDPDEAAATAAARRAAATAAAAEARAEGSGRGGGGGKLPG